MFFVLFGVAPGLYKADIEGAFRRVPVRPSHRWACGVTFKHMGKVCNLLTQGLCICVCVPQAYASQHFAGPMGSVGAVHAWERVGAGVAHLARTFLFLAVMQYVDDYFGPER